MSAETPDSRISFEDWDLSLFDRLLECYVVDGVVNYPGFQQNPEFRQFIDQTGNVDRSSLLTRQQKLSFYINAYNALAIKGIIDGLSPATFFGRLRFFVFRKYRIAGERLSLLSIEHRRIIPLGEPRSHFAINCASASCPVLCSGAFQPEQLDQQLETAAHRFVRSSTRVDTESGITSTSRLFKWYRSEFERSGGGLDSFLSRYLDGASGEPADRRPGEPDFDAYDWSLNGQPPES